MSDKRSCDFCGQSVDNDDYYVTNFDDSIFCSAECAGQAADYASGMTGGVITITRKM